MSNAVSAPFRGTQIVYALGERPDRAPSVHPLSIGALLSKAIHVLAYFGPYLPRAFDVHADSRSLSCHESSFLGFLGHLWKSDWAEGRDATPYDVTFRASDERDELLVVPALASPPSDLNHISITVP